MTIFINIYFLCNSQIHFVDVKDEFRVVYLLKFVKTCAHQDMIMALDRHVLKCYISGCICSVKP